MSSDAGRFVPSLKTLVKTWDATGGGPFAVGTAGGLATSKAVDATMDMFLGPSPISVVALQIERQMGSSTPGHTGQNVALGPFGIGEQSVAVLGLTVDDPQPAGAAEALLA